MPPPITTTRRPTGSAGQIARLAQFGDEVDGIVDAVGVLAIGAQRVDAAKPHAEEHRVVIRRSGRRAEKSRPSALPFSMAMPPIAVT